MKIVKFKDGTYGVRKGCWLFGYSFVSTNNPDFWYSNPDTIYPYCRFRTIEDARKVYNMLKLGHEVVE